MVQTRQCDLGTGAAIFGGTLFPFKLFGKLILLQLINSATMQFWTQTKCDEPYNIGNIVNLLPRDPKYVNRLLQKNPIYI